MIGSRAGDVFPPRTLLYVNAAGSTACRKGSRVRKDRNAWVGGHGSPQVRRERETHVGPNARGRFTGRGSPAAEARRWNDGPTLLP